MDARLPGTIFTAALMGAAAFCCAAAAPAQADTYWRVSGQIQGSYSNSVTWNNCGTYTVINSNSQQHIDATAKLTPKFTGRYGSRTGFGAGVGLSVSGNWTLSGSFAPRVQDAAGGLVCGAQTSFQCAGKVIKGQGAPGKLVLYNVGKYVRGHFIAFPGMDEDAALHPPANPLCSPDGAAEGLLVAPLWGMGTTDVDSDAYIAEVKIAKARLRGRKSFSVTLPKSKPSGCTEFYASCTETGGFQMTLNFKHARKK